MITETIGLWNGNALNLAASADNGRPPLLLLHGVTRNWQDFVTLIPSLASRWHVHALDFRGHGRSEHATGQYRVADYLADTIALLREHFHREVVLYGHSLGAMVAAALAAELPGRVAAVVLEDPPFETLGARIQETAFYGYFVALRELAHNKLPVPALADRLSQLTLSPPGKPPVRLGDVRDAASLRFHAKCLQTMDLDVFTPLIKQRWLDGYDRASIFPKIRCPVLLLQGEYASGGMMTADMADEIEQATADCTRVFVGGAGHQLHALLPETVLRLVHNFLESLDARGDDS